MRKFFGWKVAILNSCFIILIMMLAGCGKAVKNETEIKADLQNHTEFYSEQDVVIQNLSIIKRQTNKKEKTDVVYVDVDVSNDAVKGQLSYVLSYNLYDEGWILDNVSRYSDGKWNFTALKGPEQGLADAVINEKYSDCIFKNRVDTIESNLSQLYYYNTGRQYKYAKEIHNYEVDFKFNTENGVWENQSIEKNSEYDWNIAGTYKPLLSDWYKGYVVEIGEPNKNTVQVKVYKDGNVCFDENVELSNGSLGDIWHGDYSGTSFKVPATSNSERDLTMNIKRDFIGVTVGGVTSIDEYEFVRK